MNNQVKLADRLHENETVRTETLPEGALFVSPGGVLYQVVMAGSAGFRKAEPWPSHGRSGAAEKPSAVVLAPGSLLARFHPVVAEGTPLPRMGRSDFLGPDGQPSHYTFPDEQLARLATQLDQTLAHQSGLAARKKDQHWILSDGRQIFRTYHYQRDSQGEKIDLAMRFAREHIESLTCEQGPYYWRYIPTWKETLPKVEMAAHATPVAPPVSQKRRTLAMILSIDIGYGYTKGVGPDGLRFSFSSVIGTAEDIRFATDLIRGGEERAIQYGDWRFFYGEQAVLQSRVQSAIFDRSRVHDHTYKMLFVAALVELSKLVPDAKRVQVITGLPVEFFDDRSKVVSSFEGLYRINVERAIEFAVESVFVAPQPFGSLFRELLSKQGKIIDSNVEKGRIGVIDVGTYTTDFVVSDELRYVQRLSGSVRIGWSKVISQVQQALGDLHRLELMPYEVDRALQEGEVRVRGEPVSLEPLIKPAVSDIQTAIVARARDLWGAGTHLDMILVSGGGGPHLYDVIHDVYPHARLLNNAFWANAEGLYRFGQRPATFEK